MKRLSFILSFYVFFLSFAPAMVAMFPAGEMKKDCVKTCCQTSNKKAPISTNKSCGNMICNPFMSCCNGQALIANAQMMALPFIITKANFALLNEKSIACFLSAPWHPPKIA